MKKLSFILYNELLSMISEFASVDHYGSHPTSFIMYSKD